MTYTMIANWSIRTHLSVFGCNDNATWRIAATHFCFLLFGVLPNYLNLYIFVMYFCLSNNKIQIKLFFPDVNNNECIYRLEHHCGYNFILVIYNLVRCKWSSFFKSVEGSLNFGVSWRLSGTIFIENLIVY